MPKRKAPVKNTLQNEKDQKEKEELQPKTKQAKKATREVKEQKIVKVEKKTQNKKVEIKNENEEIEVQKKETKIEVETTKEKATEKKSNEEDVGSKGKRGRPRKVQEKEESPAKGKRGNSKKAEKSEDKEEEKEETKMNGDEENEEEKKGKKKVEKTKAVKEEIVVEKKIGKAKLTRNRSDIQDALDGVETVQRAIELGDGKIPGNEIVITSWNVNGMNALLGKPNLHNYMKERMPEILCINEHKFTDDNVMQKGIKWIPEGYHPYFNCCKVKKGYSGVAMISKHKPISVKYDLGIKKHDLEGRTITAEFENFYLVTCYVPNAGQDLSGLSYRTQEWDIDFKNYLNELRKKKHVILCGDLNCAHKDIDIHNPKVKKAAGFTPEERKAFGELLDSGFVDTFRHFYPDLQKFSYFNAKKIDNKKNNIGWRLDYFLVDKEGLSSIKDSLINEKIEGSDHLPIELVFNPQFSN